jgi:hypothetical protein
MGISDFLVWLAGGGSIVAASWVLGQIPWYQTLAEKVKQYVFFFIAVLFGGGSFAITQYVSVDVLNSIAPYFLIVAFVFGAVFLNQTYVRLSEIARTLKSLDMKK